LVQQNNNNNKNLLRELSVSYQIQTRTLAANRARALATMLLAAAISCNDREPLASPIPVITTIDVTLAASSIEVGAFTFASAVALDQFAAPIPASTISFSSSDPQVAIVNANTGRIAAVSPGTALITATIDGRSGQRTILVNKPAARAR
jgi:uncharacterized protein YjdB